MFLLMNMEFAIIAVFELVESAPCRSVINKISENIENIRKH